MERAHSVKDVLGIIEHAMAGMPRCQRHELAALARDRIGEDTISLTYVPA